MLKPLSLWAFSRSGTTTKLRRVVYFTKVSSSSLIHGMRFVRCLNSTWRVLECATALWEVWCASERPDSSRCSGIWVRWNRRLNRVILPIRVHLRKPWRGHSSYSAASTDSAVAKGLRGMVLLIVYKSRSLDGRPTSSFGLLGRKDKQVHS
jgi:hypothetical protein